MPSDGSLSKGFIEDNLATDRAPMNTDKYKCRMQNDECRINMARLVFYSAICNHQSALLFYSAFCNHQSALLIGIHPCPIGG
jgi:hypothetical protein